MEKEEGLVLSTKRWIQDSLHPGDFPNDWNVSLDERVYDVRRRPGFDIVEDSNELGHYPLRHIENGDRIHMVRVDVAADVADATIAPNIVKRGEHTGDLNTH